VRPTCGFDRPKPLDPAVDRFKARSEEEQDDFRSLLASFVRLYAFLAKVVPFADPDLEKHYAFCRMLRTKLPRRGTGEPPVDLGDDVALEYYRLRIKEEGDIALNPGEGAALKGPTETGTAGPTPAEQEALSALIKVLNDRFGTDFTESERLFLHKELAKAVEDGVLGQLFRLLSGNTPADRNTLTGVSDFQVAISWERSQIRCVHAVTGPLWHRPPPMPSTSCRPTISPPVSKRP
jgi:hypothetical protein